MVRVEPPGQDDDASSPHGVAMGKTPVDSQAITEDGISASSFVAGDVGDRDDLVSEGSPSSEEVFRSPPDSNGGELASSGAPPVENPVTDALAPMEFQSDRTRRTRQIALIATLSLSLLCVAALLFGRFVRSQSPNQATLAVQKNPLETSQELEPTTVDDPSPQQESLPDPAPAEEDDPENQESVAASIGDDPASEHSPENHDTKTADEGLLHAMIPPPLIPPIPKQSTDPPEAPAMEDLPESLKQFMPFLLQQDPQPETILDPLQTVEEVEIDSAEEEANELGIQAARKIHPRADLAMRFAMRAQQPTLPHVVMILSQVTNVPIEIDWVSFDLVDVSLDQPLEIPGKTQPAGQWLSSVVAILGGEVETRDTMMVVTLAEETFGPKRDAILDLSDFHDSESASDRIAEFMRFGDPETEPKESSETPPNDLQDSELQNSEPQNSERRNPAPRMSPRQTDQLRILATEMLRRMRGIDGKLPDSVIGRWGQVHPGDATQWKPLEEGRCTLSFELPMTVSGILWRTAKENKTVCFVNWNDANRRGLPPSRLVLPTQTQTAASVLAEILAPHALQVRAVDDHHWWMGTGATYDRLPVLVQTAPLGDQKQRFQTQMNRIMQNGNNRVYRWIYDPVSDGFLMKVPRFIAGQLPVIAPEKVLP